MIGRNIYMNCVKYADEIIVLSNEQKKYFVEKNEWHFKISKQVSG